LPRVDLAADNCFPKGARWRSSGITPILSRRPGFYSMCAYCAPLEVRTLTNTPFTENLSSLQNTALRILQKYLFSLPHPAESNHCRRKSHITIGTMSNAVKVGLKWTVGDDSGREKKYLLTDVAKVLACKLDTLRERLFTLTDPDTRVIELISRSAVLPSFKKTTTFLLGLSEPSGLPT